MPASTAEERARHLDLCRKAMQCALTIIADHVHIVCPLSLLFDLLWTFADGIRVKEG